MKHLLLLGSASSLLIAVSANADLVLQEDFAYANGQLTTVSGGAWINFSGSGNFIQTSGGSALVAGYSSSAEDARRPLGSTFTTGTLWGSALVTVTTAPTSANGEYFLGFYNVAGSGGGYGARIFSSQTATGWTFGLSNGTTTPNDWSADLALNTQYLIAFKYDVSGRTAAMGVFEPGASFTESDLVVLGGNAGGPTAGVESIALRQNGTTQGAQSIDRLIVGTSITDIGGIVAVPEPSTWALFGAGLLGLGFVVRRKNK